MVLQPHVPETTEQWAKVAMVVPAEPLELGGSLFQIQFYIQSE